MSSLSSELMDFDEVRNLQQRKYQKMLEKEQGHRKAIDFIVILQQREPLI